MPTAPRSDSLSRDSITYITTEANDVYVTWDGEHERDTLLGDVLLTQDSLFMACDRAYILDKIYAQAYDNVTIIHEDSLTIFADSLYYDGIDKMAYLNGRVILQEGEKLLHTNELTYDLNTKIAYFDTGGTIVEASNIIKSREGYYYSRLKEAKLIGNVSFHDSTKTMYTDSILYSSSRRQLNFISPTTIFGDSTEIYCESGIYRLNENKGILSQNIKVTSHDGTIITSAILKVDDNIGEYTFLIYPKIEQTHAHAHADTIIYYSKDKYIDLIGHASYQNESESLTAPIIRYGLATQQFESLGRARVVNDQNQIEANQIKEDSSHTTHLHGNVSILDISQGITLLSDHAIKTAQTMKAFSEGDQPLMIYAMDQDSLYLKGDTLEMVHLHEGTDSMIQYYLASQHVQLLKGNVRGKAQKFVYNKVDSIITMSQSPVLWSDSLQLSADTIILYISGQQIQQIDLIGNAFVLSPEEGGHLNQIKAEKILNYLLDGDINLSKAIQNSEMLYLLRNNGKYEGINITKSKTMIFNFVDGELDRFTTEDQQDSNIYEYQSSMDIKQYYLGGYVWRIDELPIIQTFDIPINK